MGTTPENGGFTGPFYSEKSHKTCAEHYQRPPEEPCLHPARGDWGRVAIDVSILQQPEDYSYHGLRAVVDKHGLGVIPVGWRLVFGTRGMSLKPSWVQ